MSNVSGDDFGCCSSWSTGCGAGVGCRYGVHASTEEGKADSATHAMKHCSVFYKFYINPDQDFIATWKAAAIEANLPQDQRKPIRQVRMNRVAEREHENKVNDALKEAENLLKSLGI